MKKAKSSKKKADDVRIFTATYLTAVNRNLELIKENKVLADELEQLRSTNTIITTEPGNINNNIRLKMFTNREKKVYYFTDIIQLIQYNSPELLVKILRQVHHNNSVLNINEMTEVLNKHEPSIADYSESIPNELYILKALADSIETVKEVNCSE
jgi:bifunctional N-acetylglucosamine-1-phosphate-uridyltransferase/glucosamine-1-phosphate-acetyltransferase GlmU-like protein